jgi:HTH-type transcriptional regulator / antitoxin HigA
MMDRTPVETFPPGDFLKEELEARGWTQTDLAEILGRPIQVINEIIVGKKAITPETAKGLAGAFGTSAQYWLNLETAYQLGRVKNPDPDVVRRAKLYALAPLKDMIKRGWIAASSTVEVLEKQLCEFFIIDSLDEMPAFLPHAARKSTSYADVSPSQRAWLFRAMHLSKALEVAPFSDSLFEKGLERLRMILHSSEEARHVPRILAESGIRFVVIEPLPQTRIDGACFWLDDKSPVIALSLRYDRIDSFWFSLMHELGHLKNRDDLKGNGQVDTDLVGDEALRTEEKPEFEQQADIFAASLLIPQKELDGFIIRTKPLYAATRIMGFAKRLKVHPGIVVGQLHRRGEFSYSNHRKMLDKVREIISTSALTDGWGSVAPTLI